MFAQTMGAGLSTAAGDTCKVPSPTGFIPTPLVNLAASATDTPAAYTTLLGCTPGVNMASMGMISNGNEAGCLGGMVSQLICGQNNYFVGCITIFTGGTPLQRMTSVTGQNSAGKAPNMVGATLSPSQVSVLTLG